MGFEDRDYAADVPARRQLFGGGGRWGAAGTLMAVLGGVWLLQLLTLRGGNGLEPGVLREWLGLDVGAVTGGQVWRVFTYGFLHHEFSIFHIGGTLLVLFFVGRFAESRLGPREFTLFYLAATLAGGVGMTLLALLAPNLGGIAGGGVAGEGAVRWEDCVGASGPVLALIVLIALWDPHQRWSVILFTIPAWVVAAVACGLTALMVAGSAVGGNPLGYATAAGVGAGLFALAYTRFGWRLSDTADRLPTARGLALPGRPGRRPALRVHRPADEDDEDRGDGFDDDLDRRADALLEKVHREGIDSLTRRERKTLQKASDRAKARRGV